MKLVTALWLLGCGLAHGGEQEAGTPAQAEESDMPAGVETDYIEDPTLHHMNAIEVHHPVGWHFRGAMYLDAVRDTLTKPGCSPFQWGSYRVTSPDGLSFAEQMPTATWQWETGPRANASYGSTCFPIHGSMAAEELLKRMAVMLRVGYAAGEPIPAELAARQAGHVAQINANWAKQSNGDASMTMTLTGESARARVRFMNGTYLMAGRMEVQIICTVAMDWLAKSQAGGKKLPRDHQVEEPTLIHTCMATVIYLVAPETRYEDLVAEWDQPLPGFTGFGAQGMGSRPLAAWVTPQAAKAAEVPKGGLEAAFIRDEERLGFKEDLARTVAAREWIAREAKGVTDIPWDLLPARELELAGSVRTRHPDWVDALLGGEVGTDAFGEKTLLLPKGIEWRDAPGEHWFVTYEPTADPNGILPGRWMRGRIQNPIPQ